MVLFYKSSCLGCGVKHSSSSLLSSCSPMETIKKNCSIVVLLITILSTLSAASSDRKAYIVRLHEGKIKNSYRIQDDSKQWHELLLDSIHELSIQVAEEGEATPPELLYVYDTGFFGLAAKLSTTQLEILKKIDGFVSVTPESNISLHTTHTPQFLGLQRGKGLWHTSNLKRDVIIGVVDSGVWPEHASFQDGGLTSVPSRWKGSCQKGTKFSPSNCNNKLIGAKVFLKSYEAQHGRLNETEEYRSPRDADGHGTHTASTAAGNLVPSANLFGFANGTAAGMRFASRIAVYKACFRAGCVISDVLSAMLEAIEDGVDVLSISLGTRNAPSPYYEDPLAVVAFAAVAKGIVVVVSAGNSGPFKGSVVNAAPWFLTVAASSVDRSFPTLVKLGNGQTFQGSSLYSGRATKQLPIVYGKTAGGRGAEYCIPGSLNQKLVKGKIVVCLMGKIEGPEKGELVKSAGGAGMLILNSQLYGEQLIAEPHVFPASALGALADKAILEYVNSSKVPTASITFKGTSYGNRAPKVAAFSSRGPNFVGLDVIKPDLTAPGLNILAAWPDIPPAELKNDKTKVLFNVISGTSMSCPHVSGIAALIKSKHKDWSPAAIKSAMMTTAYSLDNKGSPITDFAFRGPATPYAMGSGHVDPESAADPGLIYDISATDYLYYLCSLGYNSSQIGSVVDDFTCPKKAVMQPGDLNYPSFSVLFKDKSQHSLVTYKRTVKNVGTPKSTYQVHVQEPNGVPVTVRPNTLKFTKIGQKLNFKVTFVGSKQTVLKGKSTFGSLMWVSGKYKVRSPIAITWN